MQHLISLFDISADQLQLLLTRAQQLKARIAQHRDAPRFAGRVLGLLFDKPSLRTRVSFEAAIAHLGGSALFLGSDVGWGKRETAADFANVISEYLDVLVCRTFQHQTVLELAQHCTCHVINGLTDRYHPCQALADLLTVREEFGDVDGRKLTFVGDGNNVARSLAIACAYQGLRFVHSSPPGYQLDEPFLDKLKSHVPAAEIEYVSDPIEAVSDASTVYTDVWTSMGQEKEKKRRLADFAKYQVNGSLMSRAREDAIFLHCLPAHREEEISNDVIDGPQSRVFRQAGNRMHAQKAVLVTMLETQKRDSQ